MDLNDIKAAMEQTFSREPGELDFTNDTVKEYAVRGGGTCYLIDRGPVEFSRGQVIEAYVYITYPDGDIVAEKLDRPGEVELWTVHLQ
jgi:hypothetical protein